jgi:hypothetical protein
MEAVPTWVRPYDTIAYRTRFGILAKLWRRKHQRRADQHGLDVVYLVLNPEKLELYFPEEIETNA